MAKRGQRSFMKRLKEIRRKEKADGKMARRHGKKKMKENDTEDVPKSWEKEAE